MFDDDNWNIDDDYLKDVDFNDEVEFNSNKNKKPDEVLPCQKSSGSIKETNLVKKKDLKTKNHKPKDDWDLDDEDYFQDFNVDEVLQSLQNKSKTQQESQQCIGANNTQKLQELFSQSSKNENHSNSLSFRSETQSENVNKTSRKNAILDIFKNTENLNNPSNKPPVNQGFVTGIQQCSNEKSKSVENIAPRSNENQLKRKKSVAFSSDSVSDRNITKKFCIPSTSKDQNIYDVSNEIDLKRKSFLKFLESTDDKVKNKPQKIKKTVIRQFPGPAGILPDDIDENEILDLDSLDVNENNNKDTLNDICSQNTKNLFSTGGWQLMMDDLPADFKLYDISIVKENALEFSKSYKKVPYLAGIIQNIDHKPNDPHVILKDLSGKIDARIHHSICKSYPNTLGTNVVILMKDVGVMVTSKNYVYIIISPKSLVSAYSDEARLIKTPLLDELLVKDHNMQVDVDLLLEQ